MTESKAYDTGEVLGTVEGKVRALVASIGEDVQYVFYNWAQANVALDTILDDIKQPTIIYVLPPSGKLDASWREIKDRPEAQIGFLCSTEFDFDTVENDNIIAAMKRLCARFIKRLNKGDYFEPIEGEIRYQVLYDHLDQNVTGILISPPLVEIDGISLCDDFGTREDIDDNE